MPVSACGPGSGAAEASSIRLSSASRADRRRTARQDRTSRREKDRAAMVTDRSAVAAANSASAEVRTGTRNPSRTRAQMAPAATGRSFRRSCALPAEAAAGAAPRRPNRPHSSRHSRSHSMAGRHQGSRAAPESARAWTGSSTSRASRFQSRKYQLEPRAGVTARNRLNSSRTRLERMDSGAVPVQARIRAYQANTAAVSPAVGPCQNRVSTSRTQNAAVNSRNRRSRGTIS